MFSFLNKSLKITFERNKSRTKNVKYVRGTDFYKIVLK